jgi:hypothetical protein
MTFFALSGEPTGPPFLNNILKQLDGEKILSNKEKQREEDDLEFGLPGRLCGMMTDLLFSDYPAT